MKSWKKFEEEEELEKASRSNLMIVDGTNLGFRFKGGKDPFASKYANVIHSLAKSYSAKHVILLGDQGKSIFRTNIYPEYKGNRDARYAEQTEAEKEESKIFFDNLKEAFALCETIFPTIRIRGVEADDLAAYIKGAIGHKYEKTWLISTDGDWDELLDEKTSRFSFSTSKEYHIKDMYDNHGVDTVDQFVSLKALMGDAGDNIIGVEGIGVKRGYNLIKEYGNILNILDCMPLPGKQKFISNLNAFEEELERNIMLVDLLSFSTEAIEAAGPEAMNLVNKVLGSLE